MIFVGILALAVGVGYGFYQILWGHTAGKIAFGVVLCLVCVAGQVTLGLAS